MYAERDKKRYNEKRKTNISLRINLHLRHLVIIFHILFPYVTAIAYSFGTLAETVGFDHAGSEGRLGDEGDGC